MADLFAALILRPGCLSSDGDEWSGDWKTMTWGLENLSEDTAAVLTPLLVAHSLWICGCLDDVSAAVCGDTWFPLENVMKKNDQKNIYCCMSRVHIILRIGEELLEETSRAKLNRYENVYATLLCRRNPPCSSYLICSGNTYNVVSFSSLFMSLFLNFN